jgi:hypothetical protein
MTRQGKIPIWVKDEEIEFTFYPTPEEFEEISKVMKEQNKTRDEAVLIVMDNDYMIKGSESKA